MRGAYEGALSAMRPHCIAWMLAVASSTYTISVQAQSLGKWDERAAGTSLDVDRYRLLFDEGFDRRALKGPTTFAPVHAPYGAGIFDPPAGKAYRVEDGVLSISAYRSAGKWRSGSVQTADADQAAGRTPFYGGRGFACQGCYFETRMRLPAGKEPGFWGGFWLLSPNEAGSHVEIDVLEWYGGDPKGHHQSVHIWPADHRAHVGLSNYTGTKALLDGQWHSYGARVADGIAYVYMDRREVSRLPVPPSFDTAFYPLVTLAIFPKEREIAREGMHLDVDYIRAYRPLP